MQKCKKKEKENVDLLFILMSIFNLNTLKKRLKNGIELDNQKENVEWIWKTIFFFSSLLPYSMFASIKIFTMKFLIPSTSEYEDANEIIIKKKKITNSTVLSPLCIQIHAYVSK